MILTYDAYTFFILLILFALDLTGLDGFFVFSAQHN